MKPLIRRRGRVLAPDTPTDEVCRLHTALGLPLPPRILHLDTEAAATR